MKKKLILLSLLIILSIPLLAPLKASAATGQWVDANTLTIGSETFVSLPPPNNVGDYYKDGYHDESLCSDLVTNVSDDRRTAQLQRRTRPLNTNPLGSGGLPRPGGGNCTVASQEQVNFADTTNAPAAGSFAGRSSSDDEESSDSCESHGGMAWIFCPVIKLLDATMNFVDTQIQAMLDVDTNRFLNEKIQQSWATIRNIAYIILIPITLVMVIGTAIGSSMIDAYTVKKAMPRLAIAVVFIALSFEICSFLILLFNTVGYGTIGLMTAPFGDQISTLSLADLFGTSGGVLSFLLLLPKLLILGPAILLLLWFFGTTFLLFAGAAFIVLMLRQLFVVGLVLVAPLAILAWIFPGNDKLWKSWWGMFSKLLIMFPLIMGIIAVGRIFAVIIDEERGGGLEGSLIAPFAKLAAYMLPYAFIPFTFKFAGGIFANIAGVVNDKEKGLFDRQRKKRAEKYEKNIGRKVLQKRADWQNRIQKTASKEGLGRSGRFALRQVARGIGGQNIQAADSAKRAAVGKELNEQIATGRDDEIRGLTVNRKWALSKGAEAHKMANGEWSDGDWRVNNGVREFKTLGGAWVNEAAVLDGHKRWGNDTYAQQTALSYEMRKASTDGELQNLAKNYHNVAGKGMGGWEMSDNAAGGAWIGAAFENQNQHIEFKHTDWATGAITANKAKAFATEVYEKKGSYPLAQMGGNTITQLKQAYDVADRAGDDQTKKKIQAVAETFMYRGGARGVAGVEGEAPVPDYRPAEAGRPAGAPESFFQTNTPGAAAVAERVRDLAVHVGVYQGDLGSPRTTSDGAPPLGRNLPPPDIPRLN